MWGKKQGIAEIDGITPPDYGGSGDLGDSRDSPFGSE
jgi:hypothetical protein